MLKRKNLIARGYKGEKIVRISFYSTIYYKEEEAIKMICRNTRQLLYLYYVWTDLLFFKMIRSSSGNSPGKALKREEAIMMPDEQNPVFALGCSQVKGKTNPEQPLHKQFQKGKRVVWESRWTYASAVWGFKLIEIEGTIQYHYIVKYPNKCLLNKLKKYLLFWKKNPKWYGLRSTNFLFFLSFIPCKTENKLSQEYFEYIHSTKYFFSHCVSWLILLVSMSDWEMVMNKAHIWVCLWVCFQRQLWVSELTGGRPSLNVGSSDH